MSFNLLKKNLKLEIIYRLKFMLTIILIIIFLIWNFIEHINNYLFFYTEINLNELEHMYYKNLYYTNTNLNVNLIEYDWYVNYNVFPMYFLNTQHTLLLMYWLLLLFLIMPYCFYEIYLFVSPACYLYEKNKIKFWIFYNFFIFIIYLTYIDKTSSDFFFYWNEDPYTFVNNEWSDFFFNLTNLSYLYKFNMLFFTVETQLFYISIYKINVIFNNYTNNQLRILNNIFFACFITILLFFINIEFLFLLKYILIKLILNELLLYIRSLKLFIYKIK